MKYKNHARARGVFQTLLFSGIAYKILEHTLSDIPLPSKIVGGGLAVLVGILAMDGLVDIIKGTHHYFGAQLFKQYYKLTRNYEKVESVNLENEEMLQWRDRNYDSRKGTFTD